jgi:hypothetical protein
MVTVMASGLFRYEDCLRKHHIRTQCWLPLCKNRKQIVKSSKVKRVRERRVRYFTFCAAGAIDVLLLDVENVIKPSQNGWFDVVCFFDRTEEYVIETQKRIPGAVGFPGDFTKIVLLQDPEEDQVIDEIAPLASPEDKADTLEIEEAQRNLAQRRKFIQQFPFDIVNLDLEEFLFKPNDPIPGRVVNALRKVFGWQRRPLVLGGARKKVISAPLDGFSLMFTTQIGPPNLSDDYLGMLTAYLDGNIQQDAELVPLLRSRTQQDNAITLRTASFDQFFRLGMPKTLLKVLIEEDWFVDAEPGIRLFEIERLSEAGPYRILHVVMDVKRQSPPRERRAPGTEGDGVPDAYREVVRGVFANPEVLVTEAMIDQAGLQAHLDKVRARGKKYMGEH